MLDVGCGVGIVPITRVKAFPKATISRLDLDVRSSGIARASSRCVLGRGARTRIGPRSRVHPVRMPCQPGRRVVLLRVRHGTEGALCASDR